MARNKIEDLRDHLFETIEMLKDNDENNMTVEKAKTIADVAQVIINSAKVEVDFLRAADKFSLDPPKSKFFENSPEQKQLK
jgi:hypothetical protein